MMAGTYLEIAKICAAGFVGGVLVLIILGIKIHVLETWNKYRMVKRNGIARPDRETGKVIKDIVLVHDEYEEDEEGTWELKGESIEGTMDLRLGV